MNTYSESLRNRRIDLQQARRLLQTSTVQGKRPPHTSIHICRYHQTTGTR